MGRVGTNGGWRWWSAAVWLAGLLVLAGWISWPLPRQLGLAVPTSPGHAGTVPLLNVWTLWWNVTSLRGGLLDYWHAPIFYPVPGAFAFSEPQPITLLWAPLVWLGRTPSLAYGLFFLVTLVLNGALAACWLRRSGCLLVTQIGGAVAMLLHPLALRHAEAIQLMSLWACVRVLLAWQRLREQPGWRSGALLGVAMSALGAACLHHALLLGLVVLATGWLGLPWRLPWAVARGVMAAAGIAAALLGPVVIPMHRIHSQHELSRDVQVVASLSASWSSWSALPNSWRLPLEAPALFPGPLLPGLATSLLAAAIGVAYLARLLRRPAGGAKLPTTGIGWLLAIALGSGVLSFGPNWAWGSVRPWEELCHWISPLARVRSPYRFAYFTQLAMILLASHAADGLLRWRPQGWFTGRMRQRMGFAVPAFGAIALLAMATENWPPQLRLVYPPQAHQPNSGWIQFLASQPGGAGVLCLPTAAGVSEAAQEQAARWMMYGAQHSQPLLNGYSGFIPEPWRSLRWQLQLEGVSSETLRSLHRLGCRWIVLRRDGGPAAARLERQLVTLAENPAGGLTRMLHDGEVQVWQLSLDLPARAPRR